MKRGRIQVDGKMISTSYVVQSSQKISHFLHRYACLLVVCYLIAEVALGSCVTFFVVRNKGQMKILMNLFLTFE